MAKRRQIYAVYRNETNLGDGTAEELAEQLKVNPKSIYAMASRKAQGKKLVVVRIGREEILDDGVKNEYTQRARRRSADFCADLNAILKTTVILTALWAVIVLVEIVLIRRVGFCAIYTPK